MPLFGKIIFITLTFNLSLYLKVNGQQIVTGIVVDSAQFSPLAYVNIQVKHSPRGTITDQSGQFEIAARPSDTLILSYVGYRTVEIPLVSWEPSVIIMTESITMLNSIIVQDTLPHHDYEMLFTNQIRQLQKINRKLPFYFTQDKKEKIKLNRFENEQSRVRTYVQLVIKNPDTKASLMREYNLTESDYYTTLARFNQKYYRVMYYLTTSELLSLLNQFFDAR